MNNEEVKIQRVGLEGHGVGYDAAGNIYFVPGAIPGDSVKIAYHDTHKRYRDAQLLEVLAPSGDRQDPQCQYFGECGGCDFLHWKYESQLQAKEAILKHGLERAGWTSKTFHPILRSPKVYGYRNRVQVRQEGGKLGFYRKRSHDIVDVEHCIVADPLINESLRKLREASSPQFREKIELGVGLDGVVHEVKNREHAALGFNQINAEQNLQLQQLVTDAIRANHTKNVLELYCGDGNLTFAFLPHVDKVMAFDFSAPAIHAARKKNTFGSKLAFFSDVVDAKLPRKLPADFRRAYDTIVTDPPRQGMAGGLKPYLHPGVKTIIYVSCSIVGFSQDAHALKKEFSLEEVRPLDMFPHTRHIEFLSVFKRIV